MSGTDANNREQELGQTGQGTDYKLVRGADRALTLRAFDPVKQLGQSPTTSGGLGIWRKATSER
jgi:hypothetical protein